jgi:hypothetical protein
MHIRRWHIRNGRHRTGPPRLRFIQEQVAYEDILEDRKRAMLPRNVKVERFARRNLVFEDDDERVGSSEISLWDLGLD